MAQLLSGSGLRLMECVRLRVKDVDCARREITVREGQGMQDRVTMLPEPAREPLQAHLVGVKQQHTADVAQGGARSICRLQEPQPRWLPLRSAHRVESASAAAVWRPALTARLPPLARRRAGVAPGGARGKVRLKFLSVRCFSCPLRAV